MDGKPILSPKSDLIFKLIFGDTKNTDILADFLQAVLDLPESEYSHLEIIDPHLKPETPEGKMGILDIKLHTNTGKIVNIEIQVADVSPMRERIVFYTSKMITEQLGKGDNYRVIKKVISIVITDYTLISENKSYHNRYQLHDKNTGSTFTDILELNVLELPKLPKETDNSQLWNWLRFLKSEREEELAMIAEKNVKIEKAVGVLKELSQDERTRLLYEEREKARRDEQARLEDAYDKGIAKGIAKGVTDNKMEIAKNALSMNMDIADIEKLTGLTKEDIKELAKKFNYKL